MGTERWGRCKNEREMAGWENVAKSMSFFSILIFFSIYLNI